MPKKTQARHWLLSDTAILIYIALAIGIVLGYLLRGARKKKKEHN